MRTLLALLLLAVLTTSLPAWAQATDPVAATELFKQGREAMARRDHATACQKFEDSARLDLKVGTLLNLAECGEHLGKIAAARHHLQRALDVARAQNDDRADLAKTRLAAIDKRVPRLTITLASKVEGVRVRRDDVDLGAGSLGSPLPVEPGEHVVTVSAPLHQDKTFTVKLAEAEQQTLAVDVGPDASSDAGSSSPPSEAKEGGSGSLRTIGWVVGGVGVAVLGAGTVFALIAMNDNAKSNETCDGNVCDRAGREARDDARAAGNIATAFFIGGGVAVATGAVLVLTAPNDRKSARNLGRPATIPVGRRPSVDSVIVPLVSPHGAGLTLRGAF